MPENIVKADVDGVIEPKPTQGGVVWQVLHTKSRQEKAVSETLSALGVEHFLPLVRIVRYYGRRKAAVDLPLFPGYVFARGTLEDGYTVERTGRVAQLIRVADQDAIERDLAQIRLSLDRGGALRATEWIARGVRVEVASGPFRGVQGVVEQLGRDDRLKLQIDLLGRAAELEIDRTLLRPIE